ncbi:MAG: endonuclease III [Sutterella sp.]|nr:endonuclease III [Sutterella sp.]
MIKVADREEFMRRLAEQNPNPKSELHFSTPFELLVAVVLSAQATDKGVNIATAKLFPVANTPEAILALGLEGLIPFIQTIGLYRSKAQHIMGLCRRLVDDFHSEVPRDFDALVSLPGVGRKTANVVLNVAFGEPRIAVDTHIFRVCNRTKFASGKTPDDVEDKLLKVVPKAYLKNAHHWILLHGRYVCKARNPECERCVIAEFCHAPEKAQRFQDFSPTSTDKTTTPTRRSSVKRSKKNTPAQTES